MALLCVAGCSVAPDGPSSAAPTTPTAAGSHAADATVARPSRPATSTAAPAPGSMDRPAASSGPLTRRSFPTPARLGAGWRYAVDPGDAEEGYAGNGTPALARRPAEIVATAVPLGCERRIPMPSPRHALEVDYTLRGASVIAVQVAFADAAAAESFFAGRASNLRACAGRVGSPAIGRLVARLTTPAPGALLSDRTPDSDPWREVAVLAGDRVALLAAQGTRPLTGAQTRHLVSLFRS